MIAELNRVLKPALPPALEQCVLAWSGHFGQAQAEEVTLLRFKSGVDHERAARRPRARRPSCTPCAPKTPPKPPWSAPKT